LLLQDTDMCLPDLLSIVFFFQAEDGIRDFHVTGVQTCALPICDGHQEAEEKNQRPSQVGHALRPSGRAPRSPRGWLPTTHQEYRSEERRVGKQCRTRTTTWC